MSPSRAGAWGWHRIPPQSSGGADLRAGCSAAILEQEDDMDTLLAVTVGSRTLEVPGDLWELLREGYTADRARRWLAEALAESPSLRESMSDEEVALRALVIRREAVHAEVERAARREVADKALHAARVNRQAARIGRGEPASLGDD